MASEMTLSSEWKTSELRHVAIALQSRRVGSAQLTRDDGEKDNSGKSAAHVPRLPSVKP